MTQTCVILLGRRICSLDQKECKPAVYFLPCFGCGARCESAEPATLRAGLPELGLRRILDAVLTTGALVFLPAVIAVLLFPSLIPSNRCEVNRLAFWF